MATDALIQLAASTTSTSTAAGAALTLAGGTPRRGLNARFLYSAATNVSGANSAQFGISVSYDGGSTYLLDFLAPAIALSTTAQSGEINIPFSISPTSVANGTKIKANVTITGAGSTPTITWISDLQLARP